MTSHLINIALIMALVGNIPVMAVEYNSSKPIIIQDQYGNVTGSIKRIGNMHYESDKYGNVKRTYKQIGNTIYILDKYGNVIGSYRKE